MTAGIDMAPPVGAIRLSRPHRLQGATGRAVWWHLLALVVVPGAMFYGHATSSLALGTAICATMAAANAWAYGQWPRVVSQVRWPLAIGLVFIGGHLALSAATHGVDAVKGVGSLAYFGAFMFGAASLSAMLATASPRAVIYAAKHLLFVLLAIGFCGAAGILQPPSGFTKPVFPFSEPSHFALLFTPLLLFNCVVARPMRKIAYLALTLAVAGILQNLTLALAVLLAAALCLPARYLVAFFISFAVVTPLLDMSYYLARLDFSGESTNLSNLVFLQGWQLMENAWNTSAGLGLGFQQLGLQGGETPAGELIFQILNESLNVLDGGFTLAKLISEFGVFGIFLVLLYVRIVARSTKMIRLALKHARRIPTPVIWASCVAVAYAIELLVRGAGYFTPNGLLFLSALFTLHSMRAIQLRRPRRHRSSPTMVGPTPEAANTVGTENRLAY